MKIGEHNEGRVTFVEGRQAQAICECGWNIRVSFDGDAGSSCKEEAYSRAESELNRHQHKHNDGPDKGIQLEKGSD